MIHIVAGRQVLPGFAASVMETPEIRLLPHERGPIRCIMSPDDPPARCARIGHDNLSNRSLIGCFSTTTGGATLDQVFAEMHVPPRLVARAGCPCQPAARRLRAAITPR